MPSADRGKAKRRRRVVAKFVNESMERVVATGVFAELPLEEADAIAAMTRASSVVALTRLPAPAAIAMMDAAAKARTPDLVEAVFGEGRGRWREHAKVARLCEVWLEHIREMPRVSPDRIDGGVLSSDFVVWVRPYATGCSDNDILLGTTRWRKGKKSEV